MVQAAITASFTLSQGVKPVLTPRTELASLPDLSRSSASSVACHPRRVSGCSPRCTRKAKYKGQLPAIFFAAESAPWCLVSHTLFLGNVRVDGLMSTLLLRSPLTQDFRADTSPG